MAKPKLGSGRSRITELVRAEIAKVESSGRRGTNKRSIAKAVFDEHGTDLIDSHSATLLWMTLENSAGIELKRRARGNPETDQIRLPGIESMPMFISVPGKKSGIEWVLLSHATPEELDEHLGLLAVNKRGVSSGFNKFNRFVKTLQPVFKAYPSIRTTGEAWVIANTRKRKRA